MTNPSNPTSDAWYAAVEHATVSDVGMRRLNNQDAYAVGMAKDRQQWLRQGHLFVVADGMGAHAAGERASQLAVESVPETYRTLVEPPDLTATETTAVAGTGEVAGATDPFDAASAIEESILKTNLLIHSQGQARPDRLGMGTTCSVLLLLPDGAVVAHVGDSRVYRLRHGQIEQLTFDHSLVWEMMAANRMTEDQVPLSVPKNVITRSLGPNPKVAVDLEGPFPVELGDVFLLCSDGLTGLVRDAEIGAVLATLPLADAAQTLVDLAKLRGGNDNITVIAVHVGPQPVVDAGEPPEGDRERAKSPFGAILFGLLATLCLLGAVAGVVLRQWGPAATCLVGAAALAALAVMTAGPRPRRAAPAEPLSRHGRGPYRVIGCRPTRSLVASLAESVRGACVAGDIGALPPEEREILHDLLQRAEAKLSEGDGAAALVECGDTIRAAAQHLQRNEFRPPDPTDFGVP